MHVRLLLALVFGIALGAGAACGNSPPAIAHPPTDAGVPPDVGQDAGHDAGQQSAACADRIAYQGNFPLTLPAGTGTIERAFMVHAPTGYDPRRATPVVLNFHGWGSNRVEQSLLTELDSLADEEGFITVHPNGVLATELGKTPTPTLNNTRSWNAGTCCPDATRYAVDDVGFVSELLDLLETELCVDTQRVYATGLSNGGFLSYRLACDLSERIAAIAPVAGVNVTTTCTPSRPVPVMHFHGTSDNVVPYDGGGFFSFPSVATTDEESAERNGCDGGLTETYAQGDTTCLAHQGCLAPVVLCTSVGAGHTWPGGRIPDDAGFGKTSRDIDANREMWKFFQEHSLP